MANNIKEEAVEVVNEGIEAIGADTTLLKGIGLGVISIGVGYLTYKGVKKLFTKKDNKKLEWPKDSNFKEAKEAVEEVVDN